MNYQKIYDRLITYAKYQETPSNYEVHHILPRSMGGKDTNSNLVKLTYRQHYVAHRLLEKITKGTHNHHKMIKAVILMSGKEDKWISSTSYEKLRRRFSDWAKLNIHKTLHKDTLCFNMTGVLPEFHIIYSQSKHLNMKPKVSFSKYHYKTKGLLLLIYTTRLMGYNKWRGYKGHQSQIKVLVEDGWFYKDEKRYLCLTEKGNQHFDSITPKTSYKNRVYKALTNIDNSSKHNGKWVYPKNVRELKIQVTKHNKSNPLDLRKLVWLNGEIVWKRH